MTLDYIVTLNDGHVELFCKDSEGQSVKMTSAQWGTKLDAIEWFKGEFK